MITIYQCEEGYLYRLNARNIRLGVYTSSRPPKFVGIRTKFDNRYLDQEYHRTDKAIFGTAVPVEKLELCPVADLRPHLDLICHTCKQAMHSKGMYGSISHVHDEPTECKEQWGVLAFNHPLFDYLEDAQKRFGYEE